MMNHLRLGHRADRVLTDKGGTIKNILQSNKSFIHYLITYPLKNTFRGYIQVLPYLEPRQIALPFHHAARLFALDVERDATALRYRPTGATCCSMVCCNMRFDVSSTSSRYAASIAPVTRRTLRERRVETVVEPTCRCDIWPDDKCLFYFETTKNFSLILKRDPCIHNGSIVGVERVYVYERAIEHNDSIYISPFILKHLNADFDGDAVTVLIVRGIESACEIRECMSDPVLFGTIPRYTFCQSVVFWIFRMLAFDDEDDEAIALVSQQLRDNNNDNDNDNDANDNGDLDSVELSPRSVTRLLHERLNIWRSRRARTRAQRIFGPWYRDYKSVLKEIWFGREARGLVRDERKYRYEPQHDDECVAVWRQVPVLDRVYVHAVARREFQRRAGRIVKSLESTNASFVPDPYEMFTYLNHRILESRANNASTITLALLKRNIFCLENWLIVHSGAKSTPRDLMTLQTRYRQDRPWTDSLSSREEILDSPYADFFRECSDEREREYLRYLDDFVVISKHVPKSSYFASGLKWVTQMCAVRQGDLYMKDNLLLRDLAYYFTKADRHDYGDTRHTKDTPY